jgi:hypothetical protein
MKERLIDIHKILSNELERKGTEDRLFPQFIKDLLYSFIIDPSISVPEVNDRLHLLGWGDAEVDYHTLQLAKACSESIAWNHAPI